MTKGLIYIILMILRVIFNEKYGSMNNVYIIFNIDFINKFYKF